jgi:dTDP-4-dehydrorhamnose 3,5-epimerase
MAFRFQQLEIPGVILIEPTTQRDERVFFRETYRESAFAANGIAARFIQDNCSCSTSRVLRGLHYQKQPQAQGKLVTVSRGEIFDVAVDIRKGSPTYGKWLGWTLSAKSGCLLYIPPGFAHGFCVLSDEEAVFLYKVTADYAPELERGILWNDPEIGIRWPITDPCLSPRDAGLPPLRLADNDFE